MKNKFNKVCEKLYVRFNDFLTNDGGYVLFVFALIAIIFAIVGFYGKNGFDWRWNVFFLFPIYIFCGWALWQAFKMYRRTLNDIRERNNKKQG